MWTVADQARLLRQMIADQNLSGRLARANNTLNAISSIGAPTVPGVSSEETPPMSPMEINRMIQEERKQLNGPCPTGYVRNSRGDCVILITSSEGMPIRTEEVAATLEQNVSPLGFEQVYRGTSALPGTTYSTELINGVNGLGFDLEDPCGLARETCSSLLGFVSELRSMLSDCALFQADAGATLTTGEVESLIREIQSACNRGTQTNFGAMREGGRAPRPCSYNITQVSALRQQYMDVKRRYAAMRGKYPGVGGACSQVPGDIDTTTDSGNENGGGNGGDGGGGGGSLDKKKTEEVAIWKRTPFIILGLTVAGLVAYRFATRASRR